MKKIIEIIRNVAALAAIIIAAVACWLFNAARSKFADEKIDKIESEAENEISKIDDVGIVNYLNSVLASRRKNRR
jgi:long-subunit fatty acid transport protein